MDKKKPKEQRGATVKSTRLRSKSEEAPLRKKKIIGSGIKVEKGKTTKKSIKKETKKVEIKTRKEKAGRKSKKITINKEEKAEKKKPIRKAKKTFSLPLQKQVEIKKPITKPQKKITLKEVAIPKKVVPERRVKVFVLEKEERYAPLPVEILPEEYGEDNIVIMIVNPWKLFIYWEVTKDIFRKYKGNLSIRLYDITGVDFNGTNAKSYVDIAIYNRISNLYFDVNPEKEFIADVGFLESGTFRMVARSNKASTPRSKVTEKGILPRRLYETGLETTPPIHPVGYEK